MGRISLHCPGCGAPLKKSDATCPYCGCSVEDETIRVEVTHHERAESDTTRAHKFCLRAMNLCAEERFEYADQLADKALELEPFYSFAHFLKFMAKHKYMCVADVYEDPDLDTFTSDRDFSSAMRYSDQYEMTEVYAEWEEEGKTVREQRIREREEKRLAELKKQAERREELRTAMIAHRILLVILFFVFFTANLAILGLIIHTESSTYSTTSNRGGLVVGPIFCIGAGFLEWWFFSPHKRIKEIYGLAKRTIDPIILEEKIENEVRRLREQREGSHATTTQYKEAEYDYTPSKPTTAASVKPKEREIEPEISDDPEEIEEMIDEG